MLSETVAKKLQIFKVSALRAVWAFSLQEAMLLSKSFFCSHREDC